MPEPLRIVPPGLLELAYLDWRNSDDGRAVWRAIRDRALSLRLRGWQHYGIAALFEAARYDHALAVGPDAQGFKLNNNHRAYLARDLMGYYPALAGFFETRRTR